jgi:aspartyl-tRNA(Asn)/glutamyl-tRNA(Gln) amidotransferase subunit A
MKIGIPEEFLSPLQGEAKEIFEKTKKTLVEQGAKLVNVDLSLLSKALAVYYILATAEASTNLARFDGIRYGLRSKRAETLDEIYDFSKEEGYGAEVKRRIMLGTFVLSSGYRDAYYKKAQKVRTLIIKQFQKAFEACDVIATPTSPFGAFKIGAIHDPLEMYLADIYTISANLAGVPAVSVPCGFIEGTKPFGLQLHGPQKHDGAVLRAAHAFEQVVRLEPSTPALAK